MHKEKMEMDLKPFEAMCEHTKNHLNNLITGSDCVDPNEILVVAKTMKELVEVKEKLAEICYKSQIIETMENEEPKAYTKYMPMRDMYEMDYMRSPEQFKNARMGYGHDMPSSTVMTYGKRYNDYNMARKYYTETNDMDHKREMDNHATEYAKEVKAKLWEMYKAADPNVKAMIKEETRQILNGMN